MSEPQPQPQPEGTKVQIPSDFKKIIVDMAKDILVSFPEQKEKIKLPIYLMKILNFCQELTLNYCGVKILPIKHGKPFGSIYN